MSLKLMDKRPPSPLESKAEETDLAWLRTSMSYAVNGSLLLLQFQLSGSFWLQAATASLAIILLIFTLFMSYRRRRTLRKRPLPEHLSASTAVFLLSSGTLAVGVMMLILLALN